MILSTIFVKIGTLWSSKILKGLTLWNEWGIYKKANLITFKSLDRFELCGRATKPHHDRLKLRDKGSPARELPSTGLIFQGPSESSSLLRQWAHAHAHGTTCVRWRFDGPARRHKRKRRKRQKRRARAPGVAANLGRKAGSRTSVRTMAEADETAALQYTPTWIVAAVCSIIVIISLAAERGLHHLGKVRIGRP